METRGPQPDRFRLYVNSSDGSGFTLPSGEFFQYDLWGGWKDEFGNHYNRKGEPCFDPKEVPPEILESEGESSLEEISEDNYQPQREEEKAKRKYSDKGDSYEDENDNGDFYDEGEEDEYSYEERRESRNRSRSDDEDSQWIPKKESTHLHSTQESPKDSQDSQRSLKDFPKTNLHDLGPKHSLILSRLSKEFSEETHITFELTGLPLPEILSILSNSEPEITPLEAWQDEEETVYVLINKGDAKDLLAIEKALYKSTPLRMFLES